MEIKAKVFLCDICHQGFNRKDNMRRHIISHQNKTVPKENSQIKCLYCSTNFCTRRRLLLHYSDVHGEKFTEETESFPSQSEFKEWKRQLEKTDQCYFVSLRGVKKGVNGTKVWYLYCHRDGFYKSSVHPRRKKLKSQGTNKIYGSCPAQMIVTEDSKGMVVVRYIREHSTYCSNVGRLNLSAEERASVAGKTNAGVLFDEILNRIRYSVDDVGKSNVPTCQGKQNLRNIERDSNLYAGYEHVNDFISVQLWYHKVHYLSNEFNPVIYFKPQGTDSWENSLTSEDILLVIATKFQLSMLQQFGSNIVCVDSIHETNMYDFHLTSIIVIDENGNGIPAAFCISNRKDTITCTIFFKKLYERIGLIQARVFMSDIDDSFYNAWVIAMAPTSIRLFCTWHVDHDWRSNLQSLIKTKQKRALIYKRLRVILKEIIAENFHLFLNVFLKQIKEDADTAQFGSYFEEFYVKRVEQWAYCYQQSSDVDINVYMESLHKEFEYHYLQGRKNKRLDKCIDSLLKLARDQIFKCVHKMSKNMYHKQVDTIHESHQKATIALKDANIQQISSSIWTVSSFTNKNAVYEVTKITDDFKVCSNSNVCPLTCDKCAICIHSYSCDCVDYSIKENICKHIHLCVMTNPPLDGDNCLLIEDNSPLSEDDSPLTEDITIIESESAVLSLNSLLLAENQSTVKNDNLFQSTLLKAETVLGHLSSKKKEDFSNAQLHAIMKHCNKILDIVTSPPKKPKK